MTKGEEAAVRILRRLADAIEAGKWAIPDEVTAVRYSSLLDPDDEGVPFTKDPEQPYVGRRFTFTLLSPDRAHRYSREFHK